MDEGIDFMNCLRCGAANEESDKFCGACGAPLDIDGLVKEAVQTQLRDSLDSRLKDNKVAIAEISDGVLNRFVLWLKLFGVPATLIVGLAAYIGVDTVNGIKTVKDQMLATINDARNELTRVQQAISDLDGERKELTALKTETETLRDTVKNNLHEIEQNITDLAARTQGLEFATDNGPGATPMAAGPPTSGQKPTEINQGWSPEQKIAWYTASQGSRLIPQAWLHALEQPNQAGLFLDPTYLASFRYLPSDLNRWTSPNPACPFDLSLPLGFVLDCQSDTALSNTRLRWKSGQSNAEPWVGLNCSACHTAYLTYHGSGIRVDGGPSLADLQSFSEAMEEALRETASDPAKFARFSDRILGAGASVVDTSMLKNALENLNSWNAKLALLNNPGELRYGFGRYDAIGHIFNKVSLIAKPDDVSHQVANPSDAPVSYPFLWNAPQLDKVLWNGMSPNINLGAFQIGALLRNITKVIGAFADISIKSIPELSGGYVSSINLANLLAMETQLTKLQPPRWPDAFPPINLALAQAGGALFRMRCASCHTLATVPGGLAENYKVQLSPVFADGAGNPSVNTDMWMACNAVLDSASSGRFKSNTSDFFGNGNIRDRENSLILTQKATLGALRGIGADQIASAFPKGDLVPSQVVFAAGLSQKLARTNECKTLKQSSTDPKIVYKARPLQGIWATAPYLHNGSVPNLWEVLLPPAKRSSVFYIGTREFDPKLVGYQTALATDNSFAFHTRNPTGQALEGNSNAGHDYDNASLSDEDRWALIEFMKGL